MLAAGLVKGEAGVQLIDLPVPKIRLPDEVLIRVKEVGLDGTDFNMVQHNIQDLPPDQDQIAMGHEVVGVVEAIGTEVKTVKPGDTVTVTVRRGCGECHPCLHNMSDMCLTGRYKERGLHKLNGFLTRFVVDQEQYVIKVPPETARHAVFVEPVSIVEKGVEQIRIIQSRLPWTCPHPQHAFLNPEWGECKTALVVGAGPLGLMAVAVLRLARVAIFASDIVPEDSPKVGLLRSMQATYVNAGKRVPREVVELCCAAGNLDIIFEASGAAATAVALIPHMSRGSIYVMTGIPREQTVIEFDAARLVRQFVRYNQVIVGSVNSNRSHFEAALNDIKAIDSRFEGLLDRMITARYKLEDIQQAFAARHPGHIKTVIEIGP